MDRLPLCCTGPDFWRSIPIGDRRGATKQGRTQRRLWQQSGRASDRDCPRDGRPLVAIRRGQMFRPEPVVSLVWHHFHLRDEPETIAGEGEQQKNREPHGAGLTEE